MNVGAIWGKLDSNDRYIMATILMTYSFKYSKMCINKEQESKMVFFDIRLVRQHLVYWQNDNSSKLRQTFYNRDRYEKVTRMIRLINGVT